MIWSGEVKVIDASSHQLKVDYEGCKDWIPFRYIHDDSEVWHENQIGEEGILVIPRKLAKEKGFA